MPTTLEAIETKVDAILRRLEAQEAPKKPNLKISEFAQLAGVDRKTIYRHILEGKVRKKNGRISRDQLSLYLS